MNAQDSLTRGQRRRLRYGIRVARIAALGGVFVLLLVSGLLGWLTVAILATGFIEPLHVYCGECAIPAPSLAGAIADLILAIAMVWLVLLATGGLARRAGVGRAATVVLYITGVVVSITPALFMGSVIGWLVYLR